jgi:oligoribonuclease (3'-5' exoribonuclease)
MTDAAHVRELKHVCALDLETSGLDEQHDQILEVAAVFGSFVDGAFVEKGRVQRVLPITSTIENWHEKVLEMHSKNGLLAEAMKVRKACLEKVYGDPLRDVVESLDRHLAGFRCDVGQKWTLLGNSVHFDLRFVRRVFPAFAKKLSHRVIDVSSIRLFCESLGRPYVKGEVAHRAMADVEASLKEFAACQQWIRDTFEHAGAVQYTAGQRMVDGRTGLDLLGAYLDEPELGRTAVGHGAG